MLLLPGEPLIFCYKSINGDNQKIRDAAAAAAKKAEIGSRVMLGQEGKGSCE